MSEKNIQESTKSIKINRLMEISRTLYDIHEELTSYPLNTEARAGLMNVCKELEVIRKQIATVDDKIISNNDSKN